MSIVTRPIVPVVVFPELGGFNQRTTEPDENASNPGRPPELTAAKPADRLQE